MRILYHDALPLRVSGFTPDPAVRYSIRRLAPNTDLDHLGFKPRPQRISKVSRQIRYPLSQRFCLRNSGISGGLNSKPSVSCPKPDVRLTNKQFLSTILSHRGQVLGNCRHKRCTSRRQCWKQSTGRALAGPVAGGQPDRPSGVEMATVDDPAGGIDVTIAFGEFEVAVILCSSCRTLFSSLQYRKEINGKTSFFGLCMLDIARFCKKNLLGRYLACPWRLLRLATSSRTLTNTIALVLLTL